MRRPLIFAAYCCTVSLLCMRSSCSIEPLRGSSRRRLMEACKFGKPEMSPEAALLGQERRAKTSLLLSTEVAAWHAIHDFPCIKTATCLSSEL